MIVLGYLVICIDIVVLTLCIPILWTHWTRQLLIQFHEYCEIRVTNVCPKVVQCSFHPSNIVPCMSCMLPNLKCIPNFCTMLNVLEFYKQSDVFTIFWIQFYKIEIYDVILRNVSPIPGQLKVSFKVRSNKNDV